MNPILKFEGILGTGRKQAPKKKSNMWLLHQIGVIIFSQMKGDNDWVIGQWKHPHFLVVVFCFILISIPPSFLFLITTPYIHGQPTAKVCSLRLPLHFWESRYKLHSSACVSSTQRDGFGKQLCFLQKSNRVLVLSILPIGMIVVDRMLLLHHRSHENRAKKRRSTRMLWQTGFKRVSLYPPIRWFGTLLHLWRDAEVKLLKEMQN